MTSTAAQTEISQEAAREMLAALRDALSLINDYMSIETMRAERVTVMAIADAIDRAEGRAS